MLLLRNTQHMCSQISKTCFLPAIMGFFFNMLLWGFKIAKRAYCSHLVVWVSGCACVFLCPPWCNTWIHGRGSLSQFRALGDHTWGPHLGITLGDHTWGPHLGITLGDHTWGDTWGPHLGDHSDQIWGGPHVGSNLGDHTWDHDHAWGTTLRPPLIALFLVMNFWHNEVLFVLMLWRTYWRHNVPLGVLFDIII